MKRRGVEASSDWEIYYGEKKFIFQGDSSWTCRQLLERICEALEIQNQDSIELIRSDNGFPLLVKNKAENKAIKSGTSFQLQLRGSSPDLNEVIEKFERFSLEHQVKKALTEKENTKRQVTEERRQGAEGDSRVVFEERVAEEAKENEEEKLAENASGDIHAPAVIDTPPLDSKELFPLVNLAPGMIKEALGGDKEKLDNREGQNVAPPPRENLDRGNEGEEELLTTKPCSSTKKKMKERAPGTTKGGEKGELKEVSRGRQLEKEDTLSFWGSLGNFILNGASKLLSPLPHLLPKSLGGQEVRVDWAHHPRAPLSDMFNQGNTCYLNSTFQLLNCCEFSFLLQSQLGKLMGSLLNKKISIEEFCSSLSSIEEFARMNIYRQHDAGDFVRQLLGHLSTGEDKEIMEYFQLVNAIYNPCVYENCDEKKDMIKRNGRPFTITLAEEDSLENQLRKYLNFTATCSSCSRDFKRTMTYEKYPKFLFIKTNTNFRKYRSEFSSQVPISFADQEYEILGCCLHFGSTAGGHYVSLVSHLGEWLVCDDSRIRAWDRGTFDHATARLVLLRKSEKQD